MTKTTISLEIQENVHSIIADFNKKTFSKTPEFSYYATFKGSNLFLKRKEGNSDSPIARLKYNGNFTDWDFAIFKWSSERYDPEEFMFPGAEHLNGTIEGALKAGQEAYPPSYSPSESDFLNFFASFLAKKKKK